MSLYFLLSIEVFDFDMTTIGGKHHPHAPHGHLGARYRYARGDRCG